MEEISSYLCVLSILSVLKVYCCLGILVLRVLKVYCCLGILILLIRRWYFRQLKRNIYIYICIYIFVRKRGCQFNNCSSFLRFLSGRWSFSQINDIGRAHV